MREEGTLTHYVGFLTGYHRPSKPRKAHVQRRAVHPQVHPYYRNRGQTSLAAELSGCYNGVNHGIRRIDRTMKTLADYLAATAALHHHICPRQVLGVRMGMLAAELLDLDLPQTDKRVLTIVETDGCFCDGVAVSVNCWVGRRTLRVEDYGKVAATFIDTLTETAWRVYPHPQARDRAAHYAPTAANSWEAMLIGYQHMPAAELLIAQPVILATPVAALVSVPGRRTVCDRCGEEILNEREVHNGTSLLCRACAGKAYYTTATPLSLAFGPIKDAGSPNGNPASQ